MQFIVGPNHLALRGLSCSRIFRERKVKVDSTKSVKYQFWALMPRYVHGFDKNGEPGSNQPL